MMKMEMEMKEFERIAERATKDEFKKIILTLDGKIIDEESGRVEGFDFQNMGNFYEKTIQNYLKELSSLKNMKEVEIIELLKSAKNGDESSKQTLMEGTLKLVAKIALNYAKVGVSYIELLQDGILGVVNAIENYDLDESMNFIEYMKFWIKYEMIQSNKKIVDELKAPITTYLKNVKVEIYKVNNRNISEELLETDVEKTLNMNLEEFKNLEKINDYGFLINRDESEEEPTFATIKEVDIELKKTEELMNVYNLANKFTIKEVEILNLYYGFNGKRKYCEEIGKILDMDPSEVKSEIEKLYMKLKYNGEMEWINEN